MTCLHKQKSKFATAFSKKKMATSVSANISIDVETDRCRGKVQVNVAKTSIAIYGFATVKLYYVILMFVNHH